jgi:hypothetical protein
MINSSQRDMKLDEVKAPARCKLIGFGLLFGFLLLTSCGEAPKFSINGKLEFQGKAVYPATVLFKDSEGNILPANTASDGTFKLLDVKLSKYQVAIQTPKLANVGDRNLKVEGDQSPEAAGTREATVPDKFKNAFTAIPSRYEDFATSAIEFDFSASVQQELKIELKD